jgi:S-adenosylmethionine hydrolase
MAIITLTTDLGDKDIYQAALKGSILKLLPQLILLILPTALPPTMYNKRRSF